VLALAVFLSFAYQLIWIGINATAARALHLDLAWSHVALMVPISDIIGLVPIFFNGLGAREGTYVVLIGPLAGETAAAALAFSFLVFVVRLLVSALGGLIYLLGGARTGATRSFEVVEAAEQSRRPADSRLPER
jgi:hypothetical protein